MLSKSMDNQNDNDQERGIVCEKCNSDILIELRVCPICGNELTIKDTINKTENEIRKKFTLVYNMIFWAEKFDINTLACNKKISKAREQLEVGDFDEAEELINNAFKEIFEPLIETLDGIEKGSKDYDDLDISKDDFSEFKVLLNKTIDFMEKGELDSSLLVLKRIQDKIKH